MSKSHAFNMDCMEALKDFPDKYFELCCADPPYGINVTGRHCSQSVKAESRTPLVGGIGRPFGGKSSLWGKHKSISASKFYPVFDDSSPPDAEVFRELQRVSKKTNYMGR